MAYFYDIDDEEEKKKRSTAKPSSSSPTSTGYFQEIEEPVKQQLEVKQEPIQENVQPLAQQPVKQEPVQQVEQKPKNKIYSAINNAISFATGKMQEWGFVGESRGAIGKEKEKSLQQKDFEMTTGFSGENIPVVRNEMLKTNARDHIEYLDKVQKEVEELKQDNTLYLSKKRREFKETGEEFNARELLEYKQKRLKEIALEMGYFSKEGLKAEDIKDITFADNQAEGLLSFIKEDKYLAQQNITLNDEVLGKVPVDKNVWNQVKKATKSKTYLPSLLKGREAEFQEDYLLAMEAIQEGASISQLTPNQRSAIIRQTNKDWENMVDRGLLAEAPQGLSDMTGYMVDLAIATVLSGGNPLIAGGVEQITSLPKTVQRVRANTEDQFTFIPIDDKDGFRIMTTKLGTEDDVKGTVSALAGGYIETAVELLLGKGIDKLLGAGGTKLASSGVGKKVLEAPITKKLGESFVVKSISKVNNFLKKSPTAKFILQSTGLDSIAGEIAEELLQDMTNSITSGDEYEISTDYIADVASHTALLTFIAGSATRLGGAMTDAQTQAFVNEVNDNKQAYGLPEEAELTPDGRVVDTTTGEDITSGVLDGSQIVDKEGAFEGEVQETEGLEGQTEETEVEGGLIWEYGAEDMAAVPNEPIAFLLDNKNQDLSNAKATISFDVDDETQADLGYKITLQDGTIVSNPESAEIGGSPYFETRQEAEAYAEKFISKQVKTAKQEQQPKAKETPVKLIEEAKKYKSAEEFVEAQGKPLYHGGKKELLEIDLERRSFKTPDGEKFYTGLDLETAKMYGDTVTEIYLTDKNIKIADFTTIKVFEPSKSVLYRELKEDIKRYNGDTKNELWHFNTKKSLLHTLALQPELVSETPIVLEFLRKRGYQASITPSVYGKKHFIILDGEKFKTKTQLINIWNQAQPKTQKEQVEESIPRELENLATEAKDMSKEDFVEDTKKEKKKERTKKEQESKKEEKRESEPKEEKAEKPRVEKVSKDLLEVGDRVKYRDGLGIHEGVVFINKDKTIGGHEKMIKAIDGDTMTYRLDDINFTILNIEKASKEVKVGEVGDNKIAMLESKAQAEYEKTWDKLTPQQQHKVLMSLDDGQRYIKTADQDTLVKLGKGVDILSLKDTAVGDKQEIFLWGGEREGLYTDGMILFTDKPVVKKMIDKFQEQYLTKNAQLLKKQQGIPIAEAREGIRSAFTKQRIEDMSFPETQPILDSAKANYKLTPIGFYADETNRQGGSIIFRADNGTLVRLSGKYYSAVKSFYPTAEFYITDESNVKPISFVVGRSRKGIVMPMVMADDSSFTNLVSKEEIETSEKNVERAEERMSEERKIERAKELKEEDVRDDIGLGIQEYIYDGKKLEQIPTHKGKIGYFGQGTYEYNKQTGQVVATLADGREFLFDMAEVYDSTIEGIAKSRVDGRTWMEETLGKEEFERIFPNGIPKKEAVEDDDIAFYTTARRRGQRRYDQIESMADIRRNLDILRKDRLRKRDVNVEENSKLVSNLLKYIGGNVKLSKQDIDALYSQAIGVDELQYDPNGYTTLYRIGEVEVGKQTAFSATKTDSENDIAYKVHRDDIVIYLNSQEFKDSLRNVDIDLVEGSNSIENLQEVFETYGSVEDEVIATPREVREGGDDQLMLTDSTVATVREEDALLQEARKYDSAEEFVRHYINNKNSNFPNILYHGSNESFEEFEKKKGKRNYGIFGEEEVETNGFFFTTNKEYAKEYGKNVITAYVRVNNPLIGTKEAQYGELTGQRLKDANYIFAPIVEWDDYVDTNGIKKESAQVGADVVVYEQDYTGHKLPDNWLSRFIGEDGGIDWRLIDNPEVSTRLLEKGYDGIIVQEDGAEGLSYFVPDGSQIKTESQIKNIWNQAQSQTLNAKEDESKGSQSLETYESREVTPAEQLKMSEEVKNLVHKYADKVGEKYLPRGVLGVFYGKTKEIRLKGITDLYVASHEISHAIDKKYDITAKVTPRDNVDMQLREAYINLYPTAKETHAIKVQKMEGFAMAVATYIQRPSSFVQEYPVIVREMFTQGGKYYNSEIGEYLNDVSNIVSRYQSLNDLDRVATRISKDIPTVEQTLFKSKTEATVNMLQNDLNLFERWVKENGDTMTKADFTNLFRFRTQVKQIYENNIATNLSKKNVEEGKFKNFMGGLYSYLRKSVAQDVYMVYNPETKNTEKKYDFNWGTLRREVAQKGMDRQFNSLLVARRAYYDFEYADKLRGEIETIKADLEGLQDEVIAMYQKKEGERDKRAEKALEAEIEGTKVLLQEVESNLEEVESLLKNDGWDRRLVTDAYMNNKGLFEKELDMFDKLVGQDILLAKNVGIISNDKYNELKDNKGYAPFKRIIYDEVLGEVDPSEISGNLKLGSREISSLKKRTGSTKEIIYPLQSAMRNHMEFLNKSVSQDAINTFLSDRTMELHSANIKQVEWHKGIENQKDILIRMENGVRKAYAVDPMIKELIAGYLSPKQVDLLERVQQGYKQLFTIGTTGTYFQFVFTNLPRDAFNYITQTYQSSSIKAVYNLFADTAKVILGKNPDNNLELQYFQKYLALGGREMTFVKYMEGDYDAFTTFLRQEEKGLKKMLNTLGKGVKVGLDILSMPSQLSEMWYRSVEFIEAKKSGDSDVVALEKARRVTTPFHHRGSFKYKDSKGNIVKAPALPKYAPFQNASLQAFAWAGGNFIKDPKIRSRMLFMIALTTALGLEELLRAWSGAGDDDKEQFKDLTAEDLSRFIHMPKKGGGIRRIAVAEWAGSIAGTINMAVMDFILEDDVDYNVTDYATALTTSVPDQFNLLTPVIKLLEKGTWDEFGKWGTSLLPALANPIIAIMGYKTYPEFAPLESDWQKSKLPADRYNEGTSKFAKWAMSLELPFDRGRLGDNLNLSPLQLDAILTQSFGRTIGMITGKPDAWNVLKSVNREYYFEYGRRLNDYWDTKEKNDQLYNSMTKGTREYSKEKELEVFRRKTISKDIDKALDEYREAYDNKNIEKIESTRARVIELVTRYNENPSTPEMEIYLSNPNASTMEEAMRARALREISMKDPRDYTKDELADAKTLAKEFRQEALLARSDYSYSELLFGITKNDDKVVKIEEVIEGKSKTEVKKYLASLKYAGMISNDVIIKLYNAGVIDYELGKWANDLESNRNF